ncbi:MAG TPA: hypothetical protein VHE30_10975 [Polyangiaceae bacterium]|nr:hypothetical protein [Polyangiaceae bacterium]
MYRRFAFCVLFALAFSLRALPGYAAPRDAAANQKIEEAINTHYLATEFDKAEALLKGVLEACEDRCSPSVKARAWMYVGIVRGSGRQDVAGAQEAFQQALALDPQVKLDDALATPGVRQAFQQAAAALGQTAPAPKGQSGGAQTQLPAEGEVPGNMECTPSVREVESQRPIPVACTTDEPATKVVLRYLAFGSDQWAQVAMTKKGEYWRGEIPCADTGTPGKLKFYVQAKDKDGEELDSHGNKKQPVEISIVSKTDEEPPSFPGEAAPQKCMEASSCPEDMIGTPACPGTGGKGARGNKGWGAPCDTSQECDVGLLCTQGDNGRTCESAPSCEGGSDCPSGSVCKNGTCDIADDGSSDTPSGPYKKNLFGLHFAPDFGFLSGKDVCRKGSDFTCYYATGKQYQGTPDAGYGGNLNGGAALGTVRLLASYERLFTQNIGGEARVGVAFNGGPKAKNGPAFLPIHIELRGKYWFMKNGFTKKGLRPYVSLGGGIAQVDTKLTVKIRDPNLAPGNTQPQLDAYRKLGQTFVAAGAGAMYAIAVNHGLVLNLNFMYMIGSGASGAVIEPSLGYELAF